MKRYALPNYIRRTGARFESTDKFLENTTVINSTESELEYAGIPLTQLGDDSYATVKPELHTFIIGESGCGKTRRAILPSIRLLAKTGQSMVISDPKGELFRRTAKALKKHDYNVQVLNFRNPSRGSRWNPLGLIEMLYRSGDQEKKDKAMLLLKDIVDIMKAEGHSEKDLFWENQSAKVFMGVALIILEYGEYGELTLMNISRTAKKIFDSFSGRRGSRYLNLLFSELQNDSPIVENLHSLNSIPEDTRNSVVGTFENMVSAYTNQQSLQDLFSESDIDVTQLGKRPTALFFILPDDSEALYPIATVFIKQIYSALINLADDELDGVLPNKVTFILDEFANFAEIPSVASMLTAARSRGITFVLVCQSMDQLIEKYKQSGAEILLANCRVWLYMKCRNLPFLRRLQELTGNYISPYTGESCPLVDIGDLQQFKIGEVLILNDYCRPMKGYLPEYTDYHFGEDEETALTAIPDKRPESSHSQFDLTGAITKAQSNNKKSNQEENAQFVEESNELRAKILAMQKAIDERIEGEMEEENKNSEEQKSDNDLFDELFDAGNYKDAVRFGIDRLDCTKTSVKNNIAFIIRFGKVDINEIDAPFSLKIPELLEEGVAISDPFSMINMALYELGTDHFKEATKIMMSLDEHQWLAIVLFWKRTLWEKKREPEGALVYNIALARSELVRRIIGFDDDSKKDMEEAVGKKYPGFVKSPQYSELMNLESGDNGSGEDELLALIGADDIPKEENESSENTDLA